MAKRNKSDTEKASAAKTATEPFTVTAPAGTTLVTQWALAEGEINYQSWGDRPLWTLFEAAWLLSGLEPGKAERSTDYHEALTAIVDDAIRKTAEGFYTDLKAATDLEQIRFVETRTGWMGSRRITPAHCLRWAKTQKVWAVSPKLSQLHFMEQPTNVRDGAGPVPIRRKDFVEQYGKYVQGGDKRLKQYFDGKTRRKGEIKDASKVSLRNGYYDLHRMITDLKTRGLYSEVGWND